MDDQRYIHIAYAALERAGFSTADMTPHVEGSKQHLVEVAFDAGPAADPSEAVHRVFIVFGSLLGIVSADGTPPVFRRGAPALRRIADEDPITAAMRYLRAGGVETANLRPRLVENPKLVTVWTSDDLVGETFDGGHQVEMTESGAVVRCHGTHAGTIVFPSGLDWGAGTRLFDAAIDAITTVGKIDDSPTRDAFAHAYQGGQFIFGELNRPARTRLLSIMQSDAYRKHLLAAFADGEVANAAELRHRVEELHAMALGENDLPDWLTYDRYGVIVKGLLWKPIADVMGARPFPARRIRILNTIRYEMDGSLITIDVEFGPTSEEFPDGAVVADVDDARFVVTGDRVHHDRLAAVADVLSSAHAEAIANAPVDTFRDLLMVDDQYDAKSTEDLVDGARRGNHRCLFALSKRVVPDSLEQFIELLRLEDNQRGMLFGTPRADHAAIMALLVNSSGPIRTEAERLWFELSFVTRHDLVSFLGVVFEPGELPLHDHEHALLARAIEVATTHLGAAEWKPSVTGDGQAVAVKAPHPDRRAIIVGSDDSVLLVEEYPSLWDAQLAFKAGKRTDR